jgi:hypothetical protein
MSVITLLFAFLNVVVACLCFKPRRVGLRVGWLMLFGVGEFFLAGCLMSPFVFFQAVAIFVVGLIAAPAKASVKQFAWIAVGCTAAVIGGFAIEFSHRARARDEMRRKFPMESLAARLSYEQRSPRVAGASLRDGVASLDDADEKPTDERSGSSPQAFERRLTELERVLDPADYFERTRGRSEALRLIHTTHVQQFIDSPGFGVGRMARMYEPEKWADAPDVRSTRLPAVDSCDMDATPPGGPVTGNPRNAAPPPADPPSARQLGVLFDEATMDFVNRKGWGYVENIDRVAGFQVHHFRQTPQLTAEKELFGDSALDEFHVRETRNRFDARAAADANWTVRKLELVSLLTHDEPCVYVSDDLPRMDRAAEYPVRPLDSFERRALGQLKRGEDIVNESTTNRVRMLGSLRAAKPCLQCHSVKRGELLGAFSYVLERVNPILRPSGPSEPAY